MSLLFSNLFLPMILIGMNPTITVAGSMACNERGDNTVFGELTVLFKECSSRK